MKMLDHAVLVPMHKIPARYRDDFIPSLFNRRYAPFPADVIERVAKRWGYADGEDLCAEDAA